MIELKNEDERAVYLAAWERGAWDLEGPGFEGKRLANAAISYAAKRVELFRAAHPDGLRPRGLTPRIQRDVAANRYELPAVTLTQQQLLNQLRDAGLDLVPAEHHYQHGVVDAQEAYDARIRAEARREAIIQCVELLEANEPREAWVKVKEFLK